MLRATAASAPRTAAVEWPRDEPGEFGHDCGVSDALAPDAAICTGGTSH